MSAQKKLRIRVAIFAHAYEYYSVSFIDDFEYDALAKAVDLSVPTDRPDLDEWFRENYQEYTGSWVGAHPELLNIDGIVYGLMKYNNLIDDETAPKLTERDLQEYRDLKNTI